jgi:NADH dehydrogenase
MTGRTVLVTGAAGFIGKDVVARLLESGRVVRAMVRSPGPTPFPAHDRLHTVRADMRDGASLAAAVDGVDAVVHLAAAKSDEADSDDVNVEGARRLISACEGAGVARLINISTQSAKLPRKGTYGRTKSEADRIFHGSGLDVTTLRPSIVYGEEKSGVFGTVLGFIEKLPVVPILGDGRWISAPVYLGDLSDAIIACLENDATIGRIYDIGGPDPVSFDDLIARLSAELGRSRPTLHIPFSISLLAARALAALLSNPPITVSNVLGSNQDTGIDIGPARRDFGFDPIGLDEGIRRVLAAPGPPGAGPGTTGRGEDRAAEGRLFGCYMLGSVPPPELIDRYAAASLAILGEGSDPEIRFVLRHPGALPFVDAASGILRPRSRLRQKLLIMAAVLEATPRYADFFLRDPEPPPRLLAALAWHALTGGLRIVAGIPVLLLARRG